MDIPQEDRVHCPSILQNKTTAQQSGQRNPGIYCQTQILPAIHAAREASQGMSIHKLFGKRKQPLNEKNG